MSMRGLKEVEAIGTEYQKKRNPSHQVYETVKNVDPFDGEIEHSQSRGDSFASDKDMVDNVIGVGDSVGTGA